MDHTDPQTPPLAETKAEKVDKKPVFVSNSLEGLWRLK